MCLIVTGCIIAGAGDLSYSPSGYATALLCASVQAVYILLAEANERAKAAEKLKGGAHFASKLLDGGTGSKTQERQATGSR